MATGQYFYVYKINIFNYNILKILKTEYHYSDAALYIYGLYLYFTLPNTYLPCSNSLIALLLNQLPCIAGIQHLIFFPSMI